MDKWNGAGSRNEVVQSWRYLRNRCSSSIPVAEGIAVAVWCICVVVVVVEVVVECRRLVEVTGTARIMVRLVFASQKLVVRAGNSPGHRPKIPGHPQSAID